MRCEKIHVHDGDIGILRASDAGRKHAEKRNFAQNQFVFELHKRNLHGNVRIDEEKKEMIKTFIFVEDGSIDVEELQCSVGPETKVVVYRQGAVPPAIQQPEKPICTFLDKSRETTKNVLEMVLAYKMSKKLYKELEELYNDYYCD